MKRLAAVFLLGVLACSPALASFRCGTKIVSQGDTQSEVAAKCGEPTDIVALQSLYRRPMMWLHGRPYYIGDDFVEVPVENWIYNLGPNKLMRQIRFEAGVVAEIKTLGYGYHPK
jgi:hypothetical protein